MKNGIICLIGLVCSFLGAQAFETSPRVIQVSHDLQDDPILTFDLSTDLPAGVDWEVSSDRPFVSFPSQTGQSPAPVRVTIDQTALGEFLAATNSYLAARITISANGEELEVPVSLEDYGIGVQKVLWSSLPDEFILQNGPFNGAPSSFVKLQARNGLVENTFEIPRFYWNTFQNPRGTKTYLSRSTGNTSVIRILDLNTFEEDPSVVVPDGAILRAVGKDFLLLEGGNATVVDGQNIRGRYFTFDPVSGEALTVLDTSSYRVNGLVPVVQRKSVDGDLLLMGTVFNRPSNLIVLRVERDGFVEEFNDLRIPRASGPSPAVGLSPFISPDGQRIFWYTRVIDRETGESRNLARLRQAFDSSGDGLLMLSDEGLGYSGSDTIISQVADGSFPGPHAFSSEDRYLFIGNGNTGGKMKFLVTEDIIPLPLPQPVDGAQISSLLPEFSIPENAQAGSYNLILTRMIDGKEISVPSTSPLITPPLPLLRGFRYEWRIDAITSSETITGKTQNLETIFRPSQTILNSPDSVSAGRSFAVFHDFSGSVAEIYQITEDGLEETGQILSLEPSLGTGRARETVIAGGKLFVNSSEGIFTYVRDETGTWTYRDKVPLPADAARANFGFHLATAGDLLFATSIDSASGNPKVEVFRTQPEIVHETSLTLPLRPNASVPGPWEFDLRAAGDTVVVITPSDTNLPERPVSLFIFQRPDDSLQWSLNRRFEFPSSPVASPPAIATDGKHIAMVLPNPNQEELVLLKRDGSDNWVEQDLAAEDFPRWSFPNNLTLKNGTLLIRDYFGLQILRENENTWTIESEIRAQDYGGNLESSEIICDKLILSTNSLPDGFSIFPEVFPVDDVPCLDSEIVPKVIAGSQYEVLLSEEIAGESLSLLASPDWLKIRTTRDGRQILEGTAPTVLSETTVIVKAEGTSGLRDYRVFDLEVIEGDLPLQVRVKPTYIENLIEGESIHLVGEPSGMGDLALQWFKDGVALEGQTSSRLMLPGAGPADSGKYFLRVANDQGVIETDPITVDVSASSLLGKSWPMLEGGPGQRNFSPATLGTSEPILTWSAPLNGSDPVILDGKIYLSGRSLFAASSASNSAISLNLIDGSENWRTARIPNLRYSQPTILGNQVFLTTKEDRRNNTDKLVCLNATTGELVWEKQPEPRMGLIPPTSPYEPIAYNDRIFINSPSLGVRSWTLDGENPIAYEFPGPFGFAIAPDNLYLFSVVNRLTSFDPDTGAIRAEAYLQEEGAPVFASASDSLAIDGSLGTIVFTRGVRAFDLESFETRWTTDPLKHGDVSGAFYRTALTGDYIIAANVGGNPFPDPDDGNFYYSVIIEIINRSNGIRIGSISTRIPGLPGFFSSPNLDLIAFNDSFAFSSQDTTTIYDLETLSPLHELPHGGSLVYGEGFLVINNDRSTSPQAGLHAYQINDRPDLLQPNIAEALEDQSTEFALQADHFENEEGLTYELVGEYDWLRLSPDGQVTVSPTQEDFGNEDERVVNYTIRVSDGTTTPTEATFPIKLIAVNDDPVLGLEPLGTEEDSAPIILPLATFASDEESPVADLTAEITRDDSGTIASVALVDSILTIIPLADQFGTFTIEIKVTDPQGGEASGELLVTITPVNDPPELAGTQVFVTADPDGKNQRVPLADSFFDRDPDDELRFTIASNDRPELFEALSIDPMSGSLNINYAPYISGQATVSVVATDLKGERVSLPVQITLPGPAAPTILAAGQPDVESQISLNPQTGLFEQTVLVTNNAARAIGGFAISVTGLTNGFQLYQNTPDQVIYGEPIKVGESVKLTLEYYSATSGQIPKPTLTVVPILPQPQQAAGTLGVAVNKLTTTAEGAILLEFESEESAEYVVQYSFDMTTWFNSPALVDGTSKQTQWLDQGLPRTPCHPRDCPARFYRVLRVLASE